MTDTDVAHYLTHRKFVRKLLIFVGWSGKKSGKILLLLPYVQLNVSLIMMYFSSQYLKNHGNDLASVTKSLSIITAFLIISLKMACMIMHQKEIAELQEILDKNLDDSLKDKNLLNIVVKNIDIYRYLNWSFIFFLAFFTVGLIMTPMFRIINNVIFRKETDLLLIYPNSYPWTIPSTGLIFNFHFFFEALATVIIFTIAMSVDSLFLFYVFLIVGKIREITYYIRHAGENHEIDTIVKKCVTQYTILMKCRDNLEKIYGPIILCFMVINAVVICTVIYQITQMKTITIVKGIQFLAYFLTKSTQTFMYSWCGTQLIIESENYRDALYATNWYGNKRFMIAIIILLKQKPIMLTACRFSTVSVDMFVKVLNTTLSYFFLLKTLESS